MSSLFIPLMLFCILLVLNRQRARLRQASPVEPWRAERPDVAVEAIAPTRPGEAAQARLATPSAAAGAADRGLRRVRYLLDGDDPRPRETDRVARLRRAMRGPGLCSPRRPS